MITLFLLPALHGTDESLFLGIDRRTFGSEQAHTARHVFTVVCGLPVCLMCIVRSFYRDGSGIGGCPAYGRVKCSCKAFAESSLPMREPFSTHPVRWSMKVAP